MGNSGFSEMSSLPFTNPSNYYSITILNPLPSKILNLHRSKKLSSDVVSHDTLETFTLRKSKIDFLLKSYLLKDINFIFSIFWLHDITDFLFQFKRKSI